MNPRSTLILALLTAAVGAFVYFYEVEGASTREEAEANETRLFPDLEAEDIDWIEIDTTDGERVRVERRDEGWHLTSPLDFPADDVTVDGLARAAASLKFEREFDSPEAAEVYGLDKEAGFRFGTDAGEHAFAVGDEAPVGGTTYLASENGERIFVAQTFEVSPFEKDSKSMRDRSVLRYQRSDVDGVAVEWPDKRARLRKVEDKWVMVDPIATAGDDDAVEALLSQLEFMRAADFVDEPGNAELETLEEPALLVRLEREEKDAHVVEIGNLVGERRLVRVDGGERLFSVPEGVLGEFPAEPLSLRYRELGRFSAVEAKHLEMEFQSPGGESFQVTGNREGTWKTDPPMKPGLASRFISKLAGLEAAAIESEKLDDAGLQAMGLDPPRARFRILGEETEGERLELSHIELGDVDSTRGIVARVAGENTIYRVEYDLAEDVPVSAEAFDNRFRGADEEEATEDEAADSEPESEAENQSLAE